ncbi:retention module-containing protein, partial [Marinobacterium nitratireducens]|uniref:retention module-containing protein n=1 Tax=Marinobacterium nitratireducens TaxID=518897 RepID=UPI0016636493
MAIGDVAGSVSFVTGTVVAVSPDGTERTLALGDVVYEGDVIRVAEGGRVEIANGEGEVLALVSGQEATMTAGADTSDLPSDAQPVAGTVTSLSGEAVAVAADGSERVLAVGDQVFEGETIRVAIGGSLVLTSASGSTVTLASGQEALITPEFYTEAGQFDSSESVASADSAQQALGQSGELDAIQAAILAGEDPTAVAEATAAGGQAPAATPAGGPGDSGSTFVKIDRTGGEVTPEAGYATSGLNRSFNTPQTEDQLLGGGPVVSVTVKDDDPDTPPPDVPTGEEPIIVKGNSASVLEGTNGGEARSVVFLLTLDEVATQDVTVTYELRPGSASYPADWFDGGLVNTVVIPAGEQFIEVPVFIVMDHLDEGNETFQIVLISADNATIGNATANVTIFDDDTTPVPNPDVNSVQEDVQLTTSGNVIGGAGASSGDRADTDADGDVPTVTSIGFGGTEKAVAAGGETQIDGKYGTLTIHADGSYSYELTANGSAAVQSLNEDSEPLTEVFDYNITDGYNGEQSSSLTINITGTGDSASILGGRSGATVFEAGLPDGSAAEGDGETATGGFAVSATDGILNIVAGGRTFTFAEMQAFDGTQSIDTGEGTLTFTGYTGNQYEGVVTYSYTLSETIDNDSQPTGPNETRTGEFFNDSVAGVINGIGGSSAGGNLVIRIIDDNPAAQDDGPVPIAEDSPSAVTGNVLTNDDANADQPASFVAWDSTAATYGTFTDNGNGGYSYALNSSLDAVKDLSVGETLTETFTYTMQDADGDTDTATLTITIEGTDDGVVITGLDGEGAEERVFENDLADGSSPNAAALTQTGSFSFSGDDGIASLQVGGLTLSLSALQALAGTPQSVSSPYGTLTLTGYSGDKFGGTLSYSYTLKDNVDNDSQPGADGSGYTDSFAVKVTDEDGSTDNASLDVRIVDDVTNAVDDSASINEDAPAPVTGNVLTNDAPTGADTPVSFVAWDSTAATYGTFTDTGNGTYSYTLNSSLDAVKDLSVGQTLTETFTYTMKDADGDTDTATLTITIRGTNDGVVINGLDGEGAEETVFENDLADGSSPNAAALTQTGSFSFSGDDGIASLQVGGLTLSLAALQALGSTPQSVDSPYGTLTLTGYSGDKFGGTLSYSYELKDNVDNDSQAGANGSGYTDSFAVKVTDEDGSTDDASLDVRIVDDVATALADSGNVDEGDTLNVAADGVLTNDIDGADGASLQGVRAANGDTTTDVSGGIGASIAGQYGTLTLKADGSYTYVSDPNVISADAQDVFVYTLLDADGDTSTTTLTINVANTGLQVDNDDELLVDEAALDLNQDGADLVAGTVTGSDPDSTAETNTSGNLADNVSGGTGPYTFELVGSANGAYGTIQINADGTYKYTLSAPVNSTPSADDGTNVELNADSFGFKVTDSNGNTGTGTIFIDIRDDVPSVSAELNDEGGFLQVDETDLASDDSASFAGNFAASIDYGADGAGSLVYSLVLNGSDVGSGLYAVDNTDTDALDGDGYGQGAEILLNQSGNVITGSAGGTDYFTITVNPDTGLVSFDQLEAIWHSDSADADDVETLTTGSAGDLLIRATITDADGDTDTADVNLGAGVFSISDDGPDARVNADAALDALVLDESPVGEETDGDSDPVGRNTVTADFSDNFVTTIDYGTDGAGSVSYSLVLTGTDVGTGLYTLLGIAGGAGTEIVLNQSGNVITGSADGADYFTISVDSGTGEVTFTQLKNIHHSDFGNDDDTATLTLSSANLLKLVQTVTDADGDTDSAEVNLGAGVFSIEDDGPDARVNADAALDALVLDESPVGEETDGDSDPVGRNSVTADFSDNFVTTIDYGTDGPSVSPDPVVYSLVLTGTNVASGLFALGVGGAAGTEIVLNQTGTVPIGGPVNSTNVITGSADGVDYFTISVDSAGQVTFTQLENIFHANTGSDDDTSTLTLSSANLLKLVQTVWDADQDTDSAEINLGAGVFSIEDDGPDARVDGQAALDALVLDE